MIKSIHQSYFNSIFMQAWDGENSKREINKDVMTEIIHILQTVDCLDPSANNNHALNTCCALGNELLLQHLLQHPHLHIAESNNNAIFEASAHGHVHILKRLLSDERFYPNCDAMSYAAAANHYEVVELLLIDGRVDPSEEHFRPLRWAHESSNDRIETLLLRHLGLSHVPL
jgi:hypothetical protein